MIKQKTIAFFKNLIKVTLPTLLLLFLLFEFIVFRFLIPTPDWIYYAFDQEFDVLKFETTNVPKQGYYSQGTRGTHKAQWKINSEGWMSDREYDNSPNQPLIAIVGDSYVEARQVNTGEAFPQLLDQHYGDSVAVYGFGISGAPLSNYLQMAKYVDVNFDPDILVINLVHNDFFQSLTDYSKTFWTDVYWTLLEKEETYTWQRPKTDVVFWQKDKGSVWKKVKYGLKQSAVFRYFHFNGKKMFKRKSVEDTYEGNIKVNFSIKEKEDVQKVTNYLIGQFKELFPNKRVIFMMDAPRKSIYDGKLHESKVFWLNSLITEACESYGFELIDLTETFARDYKKNAVRFEFEQDAHWNAYGHSLVASRLYEYLSKSE